MVFGDNKCNIDLVLRKVFTGYEKLCAYLSLMSSLKKEGNLVIRWNPL